MTSTIKVQVEFDWRGDSLSYQAELELPLYLTNLDDLLHNLPTQIARQNGLDLDSIQYEWMLSNPIQVIDFNPHIECDLPPLPMDAEAFLQRYQTLGTQTYLQKIAADYCLDLNANPHLTQALTAAYKLGREHR
jgi:hypothetical protein